MKHIDHYELTNCKAIAVSAGDTEYQNAVLLVDTRFTGVDRFSVIFDCCEDYFESVDDIDHQADSTSTYQEDIDTVLIADRPYRDFVF